MSDRLRSEFLKLRSTRTSVGLLLGMVAFTLFVAIVQGYSTGLLSLEGADEQRSLFGVGGVATLFAALVGVMAVTSEFRHGTIRPTLLFTPQRPQLLVAKLLAGLLMGALFAVVAESLAFLAGTLVLQTRGIGFALDAGDVAAIAAGVIASSALWAGIGVGVGAIVRSQVGAIIGLFAWILIAESILFGLLPKIGRYSAGPASQALSGGNDSNLLDPAVGGLVLVGWVVLCAALGTASLVARDID